MGVDLTFGWVILVLGEEVVTFFELLGLEFTHAFLFVEVGVPLRLADSHAVEIQDALSMQFA